MIDNREKVTLVDLIKADHVEILSNNIASGRDFRLAANPGRSHFILSFVRESVEAGRFSNILLDRNLDIKLDLEADSSAKFDDNGSFLGSIDKGSLVRVELDSLRQTISPLNIPTTSSVKDFVMTDRYLLIFNGRDSFINFIDSGAPLRTLTELRGLSIDRRGLLLAYQESKQSLLIINIFAATLNPLAETTTTGMVEKVIFRDSQQLLVLGNDVSSNWTRLRRLLIDPRAIATAIDVWLQHDQF